jgi:hypothetical protein
MRPTMSPCPYHELSSPLAARKALVLAPSTRHAEAGSHPVNLDLNCLALRAAMASSLSAALTNPTVVIDNGSGVLKVGFAGEERPQIVVQSLVGTPRHEKVMPQSELGGKQ